MQTVITCGCSFSETRFLKTWPVHFSAQFPNHKHISTGMSSQGNGLISRTCIYKVSEQLKESKAEDVIVGILWSGPDRHDFYHDENIGKLDRDYKSNLDGWQENPAGFIDNRKHWYITNSYWKTKHAQTYYRYFHTRTGGVISTLENMLRTQWFLEKNNIKYFMGTYMDETLEIDFINSNPSMKHLYDMLDMSKFLPVGGMGQWCRHNTDLPFTEDNQHPSSAQHKVFTDKVILPFWKNTYGLDKY